jgi:hypothetical protein
MSRPSAATQNVGESLHETAAGARVITTPAVAASARAVTTVETTAAHAIAEREE